MQCPIVCTPLQDQERKGTTPKCLYICMHVHTQRARAHTHTHARTHVRAHTYTLTARTHTHTHTHTYTHTFLHSATGLPRSAIVGVLGGGQLGRMMALAAVGEGRNYCLAAHETYI